MGISDWVLIFSTLILGVMALLVPYVIERWKYRFYSAKLAFEFLHKPPYCHKTEFRGPNFHLPVYYFRFKVSNDEGRVQAEQCEAVLEKIWREDTNGKLRVYKGFSPVFLKWSGIEGQQYFTIQPGRSVFCDIGRIQHPDREPPSSYKDITEGQKKMNKFFF